MISTERFTVNDGGGAAAAPDTRREVFGLRDAGVAVCRLIPGEKNPGYKGWTTRSLEVDDFGPGDMVGIMTGPLSDCGRAGHALVCVDLDSAEALRLADEYLPDTGMVEGRPGKPRSHRYYLIPCDTIPPWAVSEAAEAAPACIAATGHAGAFLKHFTTEAKVGVLDVLGTGGQASAPPSLHPSGERRAWEGGERGEPAVVDFCDLWDAAVGLALACGAKMPNVTAPAEQADQPTPRKPQTLARREARAKAYLAATPPCVSGRNGHSQCLWAARAVVRGFDLGVERGFQVLSNGYNGRCEPGWPDKELVRKCQQADALPFGKPRGWLLDEDDADEADDGESEAERHGLCNYFTEKHAQGDKMVTVKIGRPAGQLEDRLRDMTGGMPKRVGRLLFAVEDDAPVYFETATDTFAWIGRQMPAGDRNQLRWTGGEDKVSQSVFHAHLQQTGDVFDAVEAYPHWPELPGHYYAHPPLAGGDGSALRRLLDRYCPATTIDRDLILAFIATQITGILPGGRPAFLFTGDGDDEGQGRGLGKTQLAETVAALTGGHVAVSPKDDMADVKKRLLSPEARGPRVLLLDNIKSLKFSWDELESLVTASTISGRQMYVGEGRRPNTLTVCLTLNGATLSKDMAQRCCIIKLARPVYSATWREDTMALIEAERWNILGDIVAFLRHPAPPLASYSRWGQWEQMVLARLPEPADAQRVIEERQAAVDDDAEELALAREAFVTELRSRGHDPDRENVFIPSREAADIINEATNERRPTNKASAYLKTLGLKELRKSDRTAKGWVWSGPKAGHEASVGLKPKPEPASGYQYRR